MENYKFIIICEGQVQETFDTYSDAYKYILVNHYKEAEILQVITKYKFKKL